MPPDATAGPDLADVAGHLGERLAGAGVNVTAERRGRFAAAVQLARPVTLDELYWIGRVTLVADRLHIDVWDRLFAQVFRGITDVAEFRGAPPDPPRTAGSADVHPSAPRPGVEEGSDDGHRGLRPPGATDPRPDQDEVRRDALLLAASADERLRSTDFSQLSDEEVRQLRVLMSRLALAAPPRRSRRSAAARHGSLVDLRSTLARSQRTAAEPVVLWLRRRREQPRKLVFLCDVSGSMAPYSRAYLQLLLSAVGGARAEAFVFATRLTRITRSLRVADADLALRQAGQAVPDWSGGTRIGQAVKTFIDRYGQRGAARGAVVVIISDGWERVDPSLLGAQMARLRRLAYRVVWVNPRQSAEGYRPLVGGMAAALPHVDRFVSGHSLAALDQVLSAIGAPGSRR
jgi:uncharacterized protein with von Willebrand factor type A (vWA) domain